MITFRFNTGNLYARRLTYSSAPYSIVSPAMTLVSNTFEPWSLYCYSGHVIWSAINITSTSCRFLTHSAVKNIGV